MVKLSKPGDNPEYVSYLEQIDDDNVLKALEALRLKAMGGSSKAKVNKVPKEVTPTVPTIEVSLLETSRVQSKPSIIETPLTPGTVSSSSSNSTPAGTRRRKTSGTANGGLDLRARMAKSTTSTTNPSKESNGNSAFVPKWKLQPLIKRRSIPTWELVTAAQEKFASEQGPAARSTEELDVALSLKSKAEQREGGRNSGVSSIIKQTTYTDFAYEPQLEKSASPDTVKEATLASEPLSEKSGTIGSPESTTDPSYAAEAQGPEGTTEDKALDEKTLTKEMDLSFITDFLQTKASVKEPSEDNNANRSALSAFLSKLDCFSMVDPIIEPTTDFEDNFTHCSATVESDASNRNDTEELQKTPDDEITHGEKEALEFLNEKGLDQLPPMIETLSECNDILAEGKPDPTHLEYISNLLCHMEYRLQDYGGYRRRNDREQPDSEPDVQHIVNQIDELKKLIVRIVEDFIDDHMVNPWSTEVSSLPSALSEGDTDSLPTDTDTLETDDTNEDASTLGEDSVAEPELEGKDVTVSMAPNPPSSVNNYLPSLLGGTLSLTSDMSTKRIENMSIASSKLESGDAKFQSYEPKLESGDTNFVSADLFDGNPSLLTVPPRNDNDECASSPHNQIVGNRGVTPKQEKSSFATQKTRSTNKFYMMKNISRLLSRSAKKDRSNIEDPEDRNPQATAEAACTDKGNNDSLNTGSQPVDQKSRNLKSQASPARRFFGSKKMPKSRDNSTRITLQETIDKNGSAITEIESVAYITRRQASLSTPSKSGSHSPTSVLILPELSDVDHELYAIESIVGTPVM